MPMYRASAPFLEGVNGDRRVTGVLVHIPKNRQKSLSCPRPKSDGKPRLRRKGARLVVKFSREFSAKYRGKQVFPQGKLPNSLENLKVFQNLSTTKW